MSRRGDGGFTLVEALVSLFVFSLISAGCVAMLMQSVSSQQRVSVAEASLRQMQTTRALLAADMAQLVSRETRDTEGVRQPAFIGGDADIALGFVRANGEPDPERGGVTSLAAVTYVIEDDQLIRRARVHLDAIAETPISERAVLEEARNVRFEFFDGAEWRDEWLAGGSGQPMPRAVALIAELPRYGEVRFEALVGIGA